MKKIEQLWLEQEQAEEQGIVYKRYSPAVMPDIFVAFLKPEKNRAIAVLVNKSNLPDLSLWSNLKDIRLELMEEKEESNNVFLLVVLLNPRFLDLFSILCEDLIFEVFNIMEEKRLIPIVFNRLVKWKKVFEDTAYKGLDKKSQMELFGQLYFLRKMLERNSNHLRCVESWSGLNVAEYDFQHVDWAVKLNVAQEECYQKIKIGCERQMGDGKIPNDYMLRIVFDNRLNYGESLLCIIHSIREILSGEQISSNLFELMLHGAGFFDLHSKLYQAEGGIINKESICSFENGFVQNTGSQLMKDPDVKYTIIASSNKTFGVGEDIFFKELFNLPNSNLSSSPLSRS